MNIVVDASAIIAVITNEPLKYSLIQTTAGCDLLAPTSVYWEIGNAFSAMLKRRRLTLNRVLEALEYFGAIPIRYVDVGLDESLRIADQLDLYAYDSYLVRCALQYHAPLLTLDKQLATKAQILNVLIMEI